jgi:probable aminopeptidase NPEPL1
MPATLRYTDAASAREEAQTLAIVGRKQRLLADDVRALLPAGIAAVWERMLQELSPGDSGAATTAWSAEPGPARVLCAVLPEPCSRHNSAARPHAIAGLLKKELPGKGRTAVVLALEDPAHAFAAGCAVARCLPLYSRKQPSPPETAGAPPASEPAVAVAFLAPAPSEAAPTAGAAPLERIAHAAESIRLAARLVDTPTADLHTDAFVDEALALAEDLGARVDVIRGEELAASGFGGLWGVGKAAVHKPALVVLSHEPAGATRTLAWVGKGIVYDTGGLALKGRENMVGMKGDMAGAAAVLGAFAAAVRLKHGDRVHGLLCLAENAIGPEATRNDDVLAMYSGKSVEVNNTDAEGRLVLADGVAYAVKHLQPDVVVDLATLTGAQLVATGRRHAGIVSNDEDLEAETCRAGRSSGDLAFPLPYVPEFYRREFRSEVADLKNSVKDRSNAQSSCAAQFIAEHLGDYAGKWLHVDMAGPADAEDRATGYGVALLLDLFGVGR